MQIWQMVREQPNSAVGSAVPIGQMEIIVTAGTEILHHISSLFE
jgi:hypothetical protein